MTLKNMSPIIILGMHRSGTSCLAGTLQKAGVNLGEVSNKNKFNPKGNKENSLIMSLNDDILKFNNASWDSPSIDTSWNNIHVSRGEQIKKHFNMNYPNKLWGFKDPRTLLNIEFWMTIFPSASLVGSLRSPSAVVSSLINRDSTMTVEKALSLWLHYNLILLRVIKKKNFPLISFDSPSDEYEHDTTNLLKLLFPERSGFEGVVFFDDDLRSNTKKDTIEFPKEIDDCYQELRYFSKTKSNKI